MSARATVSVLATRTTGVQRVTLYSPARRSLRVATPLRATNYNVSSPSS